jgi:uncharacterized protein YodC (DUF2158 family)
MSALIKRCVIAATLVLSSSAALSIPAQSAAYSPRAAIAVPARFQSGDLVRLHSGGPMMTVDSVKRDQAHCIWTDVDGRPADATFPLDVLQRL